MTLPPYDPWALVNLRHGLAADEVISALQKEIRRGHSENAAFLRMKWLERDTTWRERLVKMISK